MSFDPIALAMMKKQLPCYDTRKTAPLTIDLSDLSKFEKVEMNGLTTWKVSNVTPTREEWVGATVKFLQEGNLVEIAVTEDMLDMCPEMTDDNGLPYYSVLDFAMVNPENIVVNGVEVPQGIWLVNPSAQYFYLPSVTTGELKTIDPKFLPSGGGERTRFDLREYKVNENGTEMTLNDAFFQIVGQGGGKQNFVDASLIPLADGMNKKDNVSVLIDINGTVYELFPNAIQHLEVCKVYTFNLSMLNGDGGAVVSVLITIGGVVHDNNATLEITVNFI